MEERTNQIASDLKNLEKAVPKERLIAYAVALALVPALIVWAMLSGDDAGQDAAVSEPAAQEGETGASVEGQEGASAPAVAPTQPRTGGSGTTAAGGEWKTVVTPDGKYQLQLPPGTKLTQGDGHTYVVPESPAGALPLMAIKIATGVDKQGYKPNPGNSVMLDIGLNTYWLYTWQFKTWDPFARVVSTFKVL